jgi:hypothetical protein
MGPRSFRHCVSYPRHCQFRRNNHKFVRQSKNPKALLSQPSVTVFVGKPLLRDLVAWTINFDDQSPFEADEIKNMVAARNLPLKPGAIASPISKGAPNECLRLNGLRALFARKSTEYGPRDFLCHRVKLLSILRMLKIQSHRAPRDPPHPSLLRNDTFPREGGRGRRVRRPYRAARATSPADACAAASRPSLA